MPDNSSATIPSVAGAAPAANATATGAPGGTPAPASSAGTGAKVSSASTPAAGAGTAAAPTVHHVIKSISVDLGITTPDGLRHIDFGLEKDTDDQGNVSWTINFAFQERDSTKDSFNDVVTFKLAVKSQQNDAAQATATQGLSDKQVNHLNGPVTAATDALKQKKISRGQYQRVVGETVPKASS